MKRFMVCLLSVVFTVISCDKDHGPCPEPRDPDDINGLYDVNYSIYFDDSPLPVFVSSGGHPGSVRVKNNGYGVIELYFSPNDRAIEFDPWRGDNTLPLWSQVELKGTVGNYSFNCPMWVDNGHGDSVPSGSVQTDFVFNHSRPVIKSHAEVTAAGTIVAKKRNSGTRYSTVADRPDMYHDLDMTVELVPYPNPLFGKLCIEITSRQ